MNKSTCVIALVALCFSGCVTQKVDSAFESIFAITANEIQGTLSDHANLRGLVVWYYMDYQKWPENRDQIGKLIVEKNAPISLSKFTSFTFEKIENGDLRVTYEKEGIHGPSTGTFEVTDEEASEEALRIEQIRENPISSHSNQPMSHVWFSKKVHPGSLSQAG